jgi:hypothetical protein
VHAIGPGPHNAVRLGVLTPHDEIAVVRDLGALPSGAP